MSERILIIEDEAAIQAVLYELLTSQGYEVVVSGDGLDGLAKFREQYFSLVLLDIMMPKIDGFTVCEAIRRESSTPVIMLTALDEEEAQIRAFERNADDYITKPFSPNVLVARIKANLAQYDRLKNTEKQEKAQVQMGNILLQQDSRRVFVDGTEVELKNKEYELLLFLMSNADIVFSRETLYERIWGYEAMGDNATVAVHINRLREKIEKNPSQPRYIQTVWGAGYRFRP